MIDFLNSWGILTQEEVTGLYEISKRRELEKGDFLIREGSVCDEVAFVESGILRSFYTDEEGVEFTYCLSFPNRFMNAYSSYITGNPTVENIQAISPTKLMVFRKTDVTDYLVESPNWVMLQKFIAEQQYLGLEQRLFSYQKDDATKRYLDLIENYPEYVQQVPLLYLSSYLGISQRHLSRIRKEVSY